MIKLKFIGTEPEDAVFGFRLEPGDEIELAYDPGHPLLEYVSGDPETKPDEPPTVDAPQARETTNPTPEQPSEEPTAPEAPEQEMTDAEPNA